MQLKAHWERVYSDKAMDAVSWYQRHADHSLQLIEATGVPYTASIIDVGGGTSTLVDDLLAKQYQNITVLDLSVAALNTSKDRLGTRAASVKWLESDVTRTVLPHHAYDVWHDRAVFHFLTAPEDRHAYLQGVLHSVKPGGHVIIATFAEDGPRECSGLPVMRYSALQLRAEFGESLALVSHARELHSTPFGTTQQFTYCYFRRAAS